MIDIVPSFDLLFWFQASKWNGVKRCIAKEKKKSADGEGRYGREAKTKSSQQTTFDFAYKNSSQHIWNPIFGYSFWKHRNRAVIYQYNKIGDIEQTYGNLSKKKKEEETEDLKKKWEQFSRFIV